MIRSLLIQSLFFYLYFFNSAQASLFSTYFGGYGEDVITGIVTDNVGTVFVTGYTKALNLPVTTGQLVNRGGYDGFVASFNSTGSLVWSTYIGGAQDEQLADIAIDSDNNLYVVGWSNSVDYPVSGIAMQSKLNGSSDGIISVFKSDGSLSWSSYFGGTSMDQINDVTVDSNGRIYIAGSTSSINFPIISAADSTLSGDRDAFVAVISSSLDLLFSTYYGGTGSEDGFAVTFGPTSYYLGGKTSSIDLTMNGYSIANAGGDDGFIAEYNITNGAYAGGTYLGGYGNDEIKALAIFDTTLYATGNTLSSNFPVLNQAQTRPNGGAVDGFLTSFTSLNVLGYSTYFGGSSTEKISKISISETYICVGGTTSSSNYPAAFGIQTYAGQNDAFVTLFTRATGYVAISTFLGGQNNDEGVAVSCNAPNSVVYAAGSTLSSDFPTNFNNKAYSKSNSGSYDGFISAISLVSSTPPTTGTVTIAPYTSGAQTFGNENRSEVTGAIVGGILGGFFGLFLVLGVAFFLYKRMD